MVARPLRLLLLLAGLVGAGCSIELKSTVHGSGRARSEIRPLEEAFARVDVRGGLDCTVEVGGGTALVTLHGDDNLLELVETELRDGTLHVFVEGGKHLDPSPRVELLVPSLEHLGLTGSGRARINGLAEQHLTVVLDGSGEIIGQGWVERLDVAREGSGEVDFSAVTASRARVESTGSGRVYVDARGRLEVDQSGSGEVVYRGSPVVSARTRGSGDVRRVSD